MTSALQIAAGMRWEYLANEFTDVGSGWFNGGASSAAGKHSEVDKAPRFTARYQFAPNQMVYASAAKGFRIGGENLPLLPVCGSQYTSGGPQYGTDSLWSFEVGSKNSWLADRIKSRVAVYRIDWSKIQQGGVLNSTCDETVITNSGAAVSKGAEFELDAAVLENLIIHLAAGYEDAKITEAVPGSLTVVGQPLNQVPAWTGSATAQYSTPLGEERSAFLRGVWTYNGSRVSFNNSQTGIDLPAYNLLNLRTGINQGLWEFALFADNVSDARGNLGDLIPESGQLPGRPRFLITQPRTIGLHVRRDF